MARRSRRGRSGRTLALAGLLALAGAGGGARTAASADEGPAPPARDAIDDALALVGIARDDVGLRPRGWWERYPMDVAHRLRHVDALMAQPFAVLPYVRGMGNVARALLSPEGLEKPGDQGAGALYRAVHDLAIHRRYGATRAYSANLDATPVSLADAVGLAYRRADRPTAPVTFGQPVPFPKVVEEVRAAAKALPPAVDAALGRLVADLVDARRWADLAWRNVPLERRLAVAARLDLNVEMTDATDYEPAFDDVARAWDEASLWYAASKTVEALDVARRALSKAALGDLASFRFDHGTPLGRIVVLGTGDDALDVGHDGAWLVVDLGGSDRYRGRVGASRPERPIGALLDLSGDDRYEADDSAQGAGVAGVGVLLDVAGDDRYALRGALGQGAGQCGLGALLDLGGDDVYEARYGAQGCGYLGVGALMDVAGKDSYTLWADGQGFGGAGGVGVLADGGGDDRYEAVLDPAVTGRPSSHSEGKITSSNAQGAGMGRRGDGSDGHSWAGGLGALLDVSGNDSYVCGNWGQGVGYWFGTGFVWDGAGDDTYRGNGWCSGSGAHFCVGAVVDEAGSDVHAVKQNWGPAFGHDFTVGILADLGTGNDAYECGEGGMANAINRSVAMLLEAGGDDTYAFAHANHRVAGVSRYDARYVDRVKASLYWSEATSLALFLDVGGKDRASHEGKPAKGPEDGWQRIDPADSPSRKARDFSVAVDRDGGTIDWDRPVR